MAHDVSPGVALFVIDIHEMSRVARTVPVIILWRMERLRDFFRVDTPTPYSNGWNAWVFYLLSPLCINSGANLPKNLHLVLEAVWFGVVPKPNGKQRQHLPP